MLTPKLYECQYLHMYYNLLISEVNQNEFLPTSNLKNNENFNLLYMRVHNQNQWIIDTTSVWSYCSIPSSSQTSCYKLYTHWTLPHCHTLGVAMVPVGEQHPEKQEGKMDLIIHLRNTDYAIQITCFTGLTGVWLLVIMYRVSLAQWYSHWPSVQKTLGVSQDWDMTFHHLLHKQCEFLKLFLSLFLNADFRIE